MSIFGVKFRSLGQTSYFVGTDNICIGDFVLIEANQGKLLAEIVSGPFEKISGVDANSFPPILGLATEDDIATSRENSILANEATNFCRQCIHDRKLDMKLVGVEVYLDRSKFIFYFTAPARIDFRELVKDLVSRYHARIELRQIGVRHETQMVGAVGNCGMVCCCRRYLRKFAPVTIRMAKEQNLFLNPAKISGICGRLLCCLSYEQENYEHFQSQCPRLGKKYQTTSGAMKVIRSNMFRNTISVLSENNEELEMTLDDWKALAPQRPESCHQGGGEAKSGEHAVCDNAGALCNISPETLGEAASLDGFEEQAEGLQAEMVSDSNQPSAPKQKRKRRRKSGHPQGNFS